MAESHTICVMTVVVVYGRGLDRVEAWPTLQYLLRLNGFQAMRLDHVLIYDNSSQPLAKPADQIDGCSYIHDSGNGGTAAAYTCAVHLAAELGIDWLLLLDQDTCLPERFLDDAGFALEACTAAPPAAMLPWVYHQSTVVSPARITGIGTIRPLRRSETLCQGTRITAIASGSLLHVATMLTLLPIPGELWLDYVDHWIFAELYARRAPIVVFDQVLQHDLSIASPASLSMRRLTSVLDGEARFLGSLGLIAQLIYPIRLIMRMQRLLWVAPRLALHILGWVMHHLLPNRP